MNIIETLLILIRTPTVSFTCLIILNIFFTHIFIDHPIYSDIVFVD